MEQEDYNHQTSYGIYKPTKRKGTDFKHGLFSQCFLCSDEGGYLPGEIAFMDNMSGKEFIEFMAKNEEDERPDVCERTNGIFEIDTQVKIKRCLRV